MANEMTDDPKIGSQPARKSCPICGKPTEPSVAPFCSKRCADVDLHRWLGGGYAIPMAEADVPDPGDDDEAAR